MSLREMNNVGGSCIEGNKNVNPNWGHRNPESKKTHIVFIPTKASEWREVELHGGNCLITNNLKTSLNRKGMFLSISSMPNQLESARTAGDILYGILMFQFLSNFTYAYRLFALFYSQSSSLYYRRRFPVRHSPYSFALPGLLSWEDIISIFAFCFTLPQRIESV